MAAVTAAGRSVSFIAVSVSTQVPSVPKLADILVPLSLNSASYSLALSFHHFTFVAPGYLVLNALVTAEGTTIFCAQAAVDIQAYTDSSKNNFFIDDCVNVLLLKI
jgi:hypothetical protein